MTHDHTYVHMHLDSSGLQAVFIALDAPTAINTLTALQIPFALDTPTPQPLPSRVAVHKQAQAAHHPSLEVRVARKFRHDVRTMSMALVTPAMQESMVSKQQTVNSAMAHKTPRLPR